VPPTKKPTQKKLPKRAAAKKPAARKDFGAPIDGFFAKQPPQLRAILDELRGLIEAAAPDASSSIKWGMPFYTLDGTMMCALGGHKAHVNLILPGPEGTYDDPHGRLQGESKNGKHLKLTTVDELPRVAVRKWLKTAAARVRKKK
jgi:hypothetical protein